MDKCYLYLDGFTLFLGFIFLIICTAFVFAVLYGYLRELKRADRLQAKYNICRANLNATELELNSLKIKCKKTSGER